MKTIMMTTQTLLSVLFLFVAYPNAQARDGVSSGGGGNQYTADFINVAETEVYPWLKLNGNKIQPAINAEKFLLEIKDITQRIDSKEVVYESCDNSNSGRIVAACYNDNADMFYLNEKLYPLDLKNSPSKRLLVMHEIFRRMRLEGDNYELTRKLNVTLLNPETTLGCVINYYQNTGFQTTEDKALAIKTCEKNANAPEIQSCVSNLVLNGDFSSSKEKVLAVDACEKTNGEAEFQSYILRLYKNAGFRTAEEKTIAVESYFRHKR